MAAGEERSEQPPALEPPPAAPEATTAVEETTAASGEGAGAVAAGAPASTAGEAPPVPPDILAELRQSREVKSRRVARRMPLHRLEVFRGVPLGDLVLSLCGAMMVLGVLGEWVSIVVDGKQTLFTGLDLALRLGHLETLLVAAAGVLFVLAPLLRTGSLHTMIRARRAGLFLAGFMLVVMVITWVQVWSIISSTYGPVEGVMAAFLFDMGPGFWLTLLGNGLALGALAAFRGKPDAPRVIGTQLPPATPPAQ